MAFVGETEGNLKRVAKDVGYLLKNKRRIEAGEIVRHGVFGVLDRQVTRMDKAEALMERTGWDLDELVDKIERSSDSKRCEILTCCTRFSACRSQPTCRG